MKPSDDLHSQLARSMVLTTAIGLDLACALIAGALLGHFVDSRLGSNPIGLMVGILLGLLAGIYSAFQLVRRVVR
jgi:ATP synthase protein I